jgi:hypothetical protein
MFLLNSRFGPEELRGVPKSVRVEQKDFSEEGAGRTYLEGVTTFLFDGKIATSSAYRPGRYALLSNGL